ncbi:MAG: YcgN family cysteine cluster protein [Thalassolituus sp.]
MIAARPFWETTALKDMSREQWESLCDGCALCCLHKLEDEDSGEVYYTDVHCRYMDTNNCQCTVYQERKKKVPYCAWLTPDQVSQFKWLPETCAYRLLAEGRPLAAWHPLMSGSPDSVHDAGISIKGKGVPEDKVAEEDWEDHIIWKA